MTPSANQAVDNGITPDVLAQVAEIPLFAGLQKTAVADLLGTSSVVVAPVGTVLFEQGDTADRFYVQLDGQIELFVATPDGRESVIDITGGGETFAEEAILDTGIFPVGAKVVNDARLVVVAAKPFLAQLSSEFDLVLAMMGGMSRHLRILLHQISELKLKSTAQRLGGFLLSLADATTGEIVVALPYDKRLLANRLGMKPESLSRALAKLREIGVNDTEGVLSISDVRVLREFCVEGTPDEAV